MLVWTPPLQGELTPMQDRTACCPWPHANPRCPGHAHPLLLLPVTTLHSVNSIPWATRASAVRWAPFPADLGRGAGLFGTYFFPFVFLLQPCEYIKPIPGSCKARRRLQDPLESRVLGQGYDLA